VTGKESADFAAASAFSLPRSLKMAPFDRSHTTFYLSAIVTIALSCTVFELFEAE